MCYVSGNKFSLDILYKERITANGGSWKRRKEQKGWLLRTTTHSPYIARAMPGGQVFVFPNFLRHKLQQKKTKK
jgi:hypothetical protein